MPKIKEKTEETVEVKNPVSELVKDLNSIFKKQVVSSAGTLEKISRVPLRVPALDYIMGGGNPINRIIEYYGPESSCKTLAAMLSIAEFQHYDWASHTPRGIKEVQYKEMKVKTRIDGEDVVQTIWEPTKIIPAKGIINPERKICVLVDYEGTFDKVFAEKMGVDVKGLLHIVPSKGSEFVDIIETLLPNPEIGLVVADSITAAGSDLELDASAEDEQMGVNARFWNKAFRKFTSRMNMNPERNITLLVINRPYTAIGFVMGSPERLGGGSGIKFAKSISIRFTPLKIQTGDVDGEKDVEIGRMIKVKCMKNKTFRPFLESEFFLSHIDTELLAAGEFDRNEQLITVGMKLKIITRSGNTYEYGKTKVTGREKFLNTIEENKLWESLEKDVYAAMTEY